MKKILFATILSFITLYVSAQKEISQYAPENIFNKGVLLFEKQQYASALECFEQYLSYSDNDNNDEVIMAKYYEAISTLLIEDSDGENKITTFIKENPTCLTVNHAKLLYANHLFEARKIPWRFKDI